MRKIFLIVFCFISLGVFGQFPNNQSMGNDSTLVTIKAAVKGNKGIVNGVYADTTSANLSRIRNYPFAQIATTSDSSLWLRNVSGTGWMKIASSVGSTNIYNSNGTFTGNRTASGNNLYNIGFDAVTTFRAEANASTGKISSLLVSTDSIFFQPNEGVFIIDSLASGASTDSVLVWTQATGRVKKRSYSAFTPTWQQIFDREVGGSLLTKTDTAIISENKSVKFQYPTASDGTYEIEFGAKYAQSLGISLKHRLPYTAGCTTCGLNSTYIDFWQGDTLVHRMNAHIGPDDKHFALGDLTDTYSGPGIPANRYVTIEKNGSPFFGAYNNPANNNAQILIGFYPGWAPSGYEAYRFVVGGRSIFNGRVNFLDSVYATGLTNLSTQDRIVGQVSSDGRIGFATLGSGLSLSSGVLNTSGTVATPISSLTAATGSNTIDNTNKFQEWDWSTLGNAGVGGLYLSGQTTASSNSTQLLFNAAIGGALVNSGQTTTTTLFENSHSGATSTNVALRLRATGGTNNYALIVAGSEGNVGIGTSTPTSLAHINGVLQMGTAGSTLGQILMSGNTSGTVTLQTAAAAGTYTLTLPTTDGNANEFLQTNGSGVLTWAAGGGGLTIGSTTITSGTDTRVLFDDGGVVGEDGGFTYNKTTDIATFGAGISVASGTTGIQFGGTTRMYDNGSLMRISPTAGTIQLFTSGSNAIFDVYNSAGDSYIHSAPLSGTGSVFETAGSATNLKMQTTSSHTLAIGNFAATTKLEVGGTFAAQQGADVASANNLAVISNSVEITGTTQINLIANTGWVNGSVINLVFTSTPTVKNGQATSGSNITILLAGGADFAATANDILTLLLCEVGGTQAWREIGRSIN